MSGKINIPDLKITNVIREFLEPSFFAEKEREYRNAIDKTSDEFLLAQKGSFFPNDFLQRELTVAGTGNYLVEQPSEPAMGEVLQEDVINELGIQFEFGLKGDPFIPDAVISAPAIQEEAGEATSNNTITTAGKRMQPHFLRVKLPMSRRYKLSMTAEVENLIRKAIVAGVYGRVIYFIINGSGDGEPLGLLNDTDIVNVDGSSFSYTKMKSIIKASQNAKAKKNKAWLTNPDTAYTLGLINEGGDSSPYLINENLKMGGYPVFETNQVSGANLFFGHWSSVLVGIWGENLDLYITPDISNNNGNYIIYCDLFFDVVFRNKTSFKRSVVG